MLRAAREQRRRFRRRAAAQGSEAADCAISSTAESQHCYGTAHNFGLNMTQTLWSFQSFSQLKEANFQVAAAEASFQGVRNRACCCAWRWLISGSSRPPDQLATNRSESAMPLDRC